jgi:hypothetical protein
MWQWIIHSPGRSSNVTSTRTVSCIGTFSVSFHAIGRSGSPPAFTGMKKKLILPIVIWNGKTLLDLSIGEWGNKDSTKLKFDKIHNDHGRITLNAAKLPK